MNTLGLASLRFPAALAASLGITVTLFWVLWSFTDKTFEVVEATPVRIEFTRTEREEVPQKKDLVKPERPPIVETRFDRPQIGSETTQIGPTAAWKTAPVVDLPAGGVPLGGRDTDAVPLVRVNPTYPPREAARGIEGWVRVQFDISPSGAVTNVVAVESEPGTAFDKAATDAVARWRYNPSVENGQAVERVGMQTLIRFNLEDAQ
jgi:periplasmic protein TonB